MKCKQQVINIRGLDCPPELEEKFNSWYNEVHIPMLFESGEIKKVTSFRRISGEDDYPKYIAVYEFEDQQAFERYNSSNALAEARKEARQTWGNRPPLSKWRVQYEAVKTWSK